MRACLGLALAVSLMVSACSRELSDDQRQILETIASDRTGTLCLKPQMWGEVGHVWARIPPRGFEDLAANSGQTDMRLQPGDAIGPVRVADSPDCFEVLVPRVSGDHALAVLFLDAGVFREFGLRKLADGHWFIIERSSPDI